MKTRTFPEIPEIEVVIEPEIGETLTIRTDYQPWFLGFCRWSVRRVTSNEVEYLDSGSWKWRGRGARVRETHLTPKEET